MWKKLLLIQSDGSEWRRAETGYFFLDVLGGAAAAAALAASLAYINVQLSYMDDLEGSITAAGMARDQLDRLCIEKQAGDLGVHCVEANGYAFQLTSTKASGELWDTIRYQVDIEWQDRRGRQHFAIQKEVGDGA